MNGSWPCRVDRNDSLWLDVWGQHLPRASIHENRAQTPSAAPVFACIGQCLVDRVDQQSVAVVTAHSVCIAAGWQLPGFAAVSDQRVVFPSAAQSQAGCVCGGLGSVLGRYAGVLVVQVLGMAVGHHMGTHFIQGALVASLLGWSACMHVLQERDALRLDMQLTKSRSRWFAAAHHYLWQPLQSMLLYARALVLAPGDRLFGLMTGMQIASRAVDDFMGYLRFFAEGADTYSSGQQAASALAVHELLQPLVEEIRLLA